MAFEEVEFGELTSVAKGLNLLMKDENALGLVLVLNKGNKMGLG